ncbi:hypothetical protein CIPAW_05G099800 [Carya illinoinensis]|uniref:Uncharacterized protein n=1 Tax=Carya illinoinensis TaxID=32201 RepID=A0A8T1QHY5_CARIL|nr:hypothetical protein CIPAW_05G099800 [Carya illinoinensis]
MRNNFSSVSLDKYLCRMQFMEVSSTTSGSECYIID